MSIPLSPLADPASLAKVQVLLVPVHTSRASLSEATFARWASLFKRNKVLRGDELAWPTPNSHQHQRGPSANPRDRFLPVSSASSISRGATTNRVHLAYPTHPPAKHLDSLSLLRIAAFPLIVIGVATHSEEGVQGYDVGDGDLGGSKESGITTSMDHLLAGYRDTLDNLFTPSSPFPLVKRLIVVPPVPPTSPGATPRHDASYEKIGAGQQGVLFAPLEGIEDWTSRLLGEVVGDALAELGDLVGHYLSFE